jgi:hypothetical protein
MSSLPLFVDADYASPSPTCCFVALQEKSIAAKIAPVDLDTAVNKESGLA